MDDWGVQKASYKTNSKDFNFFRIRKTRLYQKTGRKRMTT